MNVPLKQKRSGATTVETAVVLGVFLLLLFGTLDLGLATVRYNSLSEAARRAGRHAIIRGEHADDPWGPAAYSGHAGDGTPQAAALCDALPTMERDDVDVRIEWPDGGNAEGDRVRVTVSYAHHPMVPFPLMGSSLELSATSEMRVVH